MQNKIQSPSKPHNNCATNHYRTTTCAFESLWKIPRKFGNMADAVAVDEDMGEHHGDPNEVQVILPMEEFSDDLELRLGRANGNIYHRRPGVEGVHDGQVMVRLKKKRFILIDYSIVPNEADLAASSVSPNISCPNGAGKQKCHHPECPKVGVPVLLYDSDPNEPSSLYMRSGLCFTCQRNLNEKRRTQRKRASDIGPSSVLYAVGPGQKKVKLNGQTVNLQSDAIILNGPPIDGAKSIRDGYSFHDIGIDMTANVLKAVRDTDRLVNAVSSNTTTTSAPNGSDGGSDESVADIAARAAAVVSAMTPEEAATNAAVDAAADATNSEDIPALYDKAFNSLSKSIYLLSQWKQSWDSVIAAAVAQETVADPSLVDAVASAAAVAAAAATESQDNMASLLLAADQRKDGAKQEQDDVPVYHEV
ncbi:unnamed protein product [Cylindrotheca closterium]|uniref:Uncharacterized protein n=1 Tax=Cylindrotheca closterium TaxID=2856 RepID=A0AAD2FRS9_9STRA|nr:unnamed protein product [Cylindrotheca closterium]